MSTSKANKPRNLRYVARKEGDKWVVYTFRRVDQFKEFVSRYRNIYELKRVFYSSLKELAVFCRNPETGEPAYRVQVWQGVGKDDDPPVYDYINHYRSDKRRAWLKRQQSVERGR